MTGVYPDMKRVLVIGCPGAGKSIAAKRLAAKTNLPLIHLDRHYWGSGWVPTNDRVWREKVISLASRESWIIDGTYGSTLEERIFRADTIIHLDYPTAVCLWRVIKRTFMQFGKERVDEFIPGCPERFNLGFLKFVLLYRRRLRLVHLAKISKFCGARHTFTRPSDLEKFLESLSEPSQREQVASDSNPQRLASTDQMRAQSIDKNSNLGG